MDLQTCQVSRILREAVHAILAYSLIHAAFMKIDNFHKFSGFGPRIHQKFCTISSITDLKL